MKLARLKEDPEGLLDFVLEIIQKGKSEEIKTLTRIEIQTIIENTDNYPVQDFYTNANLLPTILRKLKKDGYIERDNKDTTNMIYYITFDRELHVSKGGYKARTKRKEIERERIKSNERNMLYLTLILTITAIIGAVFTILEIHTKHHRFHTYYWTFLFPIGVIIRIYLFRGSKIK